jgi:hypothetical protein
MKTGEFVLSLGLALGILTVDQASADDQLPYRVVEGNRVDKTTLEGWRTWRALACERYRGAQQEGMVGPSLIEGVKRLSKDEFTQAVLNGRLEEGRPNFDASKMANDNIAALYAYLKGRSDGAIQLGRLEGLK